ncbi:MAG: FAD-dependent oxidoreductase [Eubacteriales bacterium]|nr:FAD-dependent oxidoreductase [Eubacteriales bacterium]
MYLEGTVKDVDTIRYATKEGMEARGVEVFVEQEITSIDPQAHTVEVKDHKTGKVRTESYDKLILSPGSNPFIPPIEGVDMDGIYGFGGRDNAELLRYKTVTPDIKNVVVVGGGHIGMEAAIAFAKAGKDVCLIDAVDHPLQVYLDEQLGEMVRVHLEENGVRFESDQRVKSFEGKNGHVTKVHTEKGAYPADMVIISTGVRPNTKWLEGIVDLDERGFIETDDYMRTSEKDIFAVGNATKILYNPTGEYLNVALATNARKQGRFAVKNLEGPVCKFEGVQGTSGLRIFDLKMAATGLSAQTAQNSKVPYDSVFVELDQLVDFAPESMRKTVYAKLYYNPETRALLGAQIISEADLTEMMNTVSMAIMNGMTIDQLAYADFFFQPTFTRPWGILNELGLAAQRKERAKQ